MKLKKICSIAIFFLHSVFLNTAFAIGTESAYISIVPLNFFPESAETLPAKEFVIYFDVYATDFHDSHDTLIQLPESYIYYGLIENVTLYAVPRMTFNKPDGVSSKYDLGDTDLGVEYRFYHDDAESLDIAFFPVVTMPTGDRNRDLGNGKVWSQWPLWLQKSWNDWTVYTGGGYAFNSEKDAHDFPFGGLTLQKDFVSQNFGLALEIWSQGSPYIDDGGFTILDASVGYNFTQNFAIVLTGGQSIAGADNTIGYLAFYWQGSI